MVQIRITRQTNRLKKNIKFYTEALGLKIIGNFVNHNGYAGVMIGLPDVDYHLEFISQKDDSPVDAPTKENLLVFYFENQSIVQKLKSKLLEMGHRVVKSENPYWSKISNNLEDPDGWRIVLAGNPGFPKT